MWCGDLLKKHRAAKGLLQKEIAEAVGVTEASVSRWENDTLEPRPTHARKLAELLEIEVEQLYAQHLNPKQLTRVKAIPVLNNNTETFVPIELNVLSAYVADHNFEPWYRKGDILYTTKEKANDGELVIAKVDDRAVPGVLNLQNKLVINSQGLHNYSGLLGKVGYMLERIGE